LLNAGATTVTFPARTVDTVRFNITSVSTATANIGLAEIEVYGAVANRAPVANAGVDRSVTTGTLVTLDGSGSSDPDGTPLSYAWTQTAGGAVTLSSTTVASPTFTPVADGTYVFQLTVSDGVLSATDSVTVVAGPVVNRAPVASAGVDRSVTTGTLVTLDGSASSDPDGTPLGYAWTQTAGGTVILSSTTVAKPTFTPTATGTYTFGLTVSDGTLTATDTVTITVTTPATVNVARLVGVSVTASSQNTSTGQTAVKAVDGSPLGYPDDYTKEWATVAGKAGSWIQLTWPSPVTVDRVVLFDRPNTNEQVTGGTLVFSDGTQVPVGQLLNAGATTVTFPARTVDTVRFNITSVSTATANIGLAEIEVYGAVAQ